MVAVGATQACGKDGAGDCGSGSAAAGAASNATSDVLERGRRPRLRMLRRYTGRWQAGIVTIVAARPAMGKSSLLLATADACSAAGFERILVFDLVL